MGNYFLRLYRGVKQSFLLQGSVRAQALRTGIKQPRTAPNPGPNTQLSETRPCRCWLGQNRTCPAPDRNPLGLKRPSSLLTLPLPEKPRPPKAS